MSTQGHASDAFYLSGESLERLRQALEVAGHQARVAQSGGYGRHVEDALTEIEEAISAHLARIPTALDDDKAEAEDSGEAALERQSWFAPYKAA
jgi:hypothetical protein